MVIDNTNYENSREHTSIDNDQSPAEEVDALQFMAIVSTMDCMPYGVIITNAEGRIVYSNSCARGVVAGPGGLSVVDNHVVGSTACDTQALRESITAAARRVCEEGDQTHTCSTIVLSHVRSLKPVPVIVKSLSGARAADGPSFVALFVFQSGHNGTHAGSILKQLYGLTRSEIRLTLFLLEGKGVVIAADKLGMSAHTARSHLKQIFQKTGAHSQAELVRLILLGPAALNLD